MYHAHISFYLNCGLLAPLECVKKPKRHYYQGQAPLNAVEGFIRQIIGWLKYIRGIYWLAMPDYATQRYFFLRPVHYQIFTGQGQTEMNCAKAICA